MIEAPPSATHPNYTLKTKKLKKNKFVRKPYVYCMVTRLLLTFSNAENQMFVPLSLPFLQFSTNQAILCTELFEYCQKLGDKSFSIPSFQVIDMNCGNVITILLD